MSRQGSGAQSRPWSLLYDILTTGDGNNRTVMYFTNDTDHNLDAVYEMQSSDLTVMGLSDAGAHVNVIFAAVAPPTN